MEEIDIDEDGLVSVAGTDKENEFDITLNVKTTERVDESGRTGRAADPRQSDAQDRSRTAADWH